jgi:hypothetical protein
MFITSSFTTTPVAINCSDIIFHSLSSIPVEGEYWPSLKGCLTKSESSLEAPVSTSNKTLSVLTLVDPHPRPQMLAKRGAYRTLVFCGALAPHLFFLAGSGQTGGTSTPTRSIR